MGPTGHHGPMSDVGEPGSERVRLKRGVDHAAYRPDDVRAVLDAGLLAHVGVATGQGPIVLPMAYACADGWLYVHGSVANAALRAAVDRDVCITVTVLDGLVLARCSFNHSMNYRSVVVRGTARRVRDEAEHRAALRLITDRIVPTWDTTREPNATELRQTVVVAVALTEASAKLRSGDPVDEPSDLDGPHWAGSVPLVSGWGAPVSSADLLPDRPVPAAVAALEGRPTA